VEDGLVPSAQDKKRQAARERRELDKKVQQDVKACLQEVEQARRERAGRMQAEVERQQEENHTLFEQLAERTRELEEEALGSDLLGRDFSLREEAGFTPLSSLVCPEGPMESGLYSALCMMFDGQETEQTLRCLYRSLSEADLHGVALPGLCVFSVVF
jgi:hypothetical protein